MQKTACFQFVIFNYSIKKQLEISKIRGHFILKIKYIDFIYASISKKKNVTRNTFPLWPYYWMNIKELTDRTSKQNFRQKWNKSANILQTCFVVSKQIVEWYNLDFVFIYQNMKNSSWFVILLHPFYMQKLSLSIRVFNFSL